MQRSRLQRALEEYEKTGQINCKAARTIQNNLKNLELKIKNAYHHKQIEPHKESTYKPQIFREKEKLIKLLQEEYNYLIHTLDTFEPNDRQEVHDAVLNYRSYLNVYALLRELEVKVGEWEPRLYYKNLYDPRPKNRVKHLKGNKCEICGSYKELEIHHIVPRSRGGKNFIGNIQLLCKTCHIGMHWYLQTNIVENEYVVKHCKVDVFGEYFGMEA
jgi:5-methylcytosine-specific restriction endonuclease McrA